MVYGLELWRQLFRCSRMSTVIQGGSAALKHMYVMMATLRERRVSDVATHQLCGKAVVIHKRTRTVSFAQIK